MEPHASTLALGLQLGVSAMLVLVMTIVHSLGLIGIAKLLHLDPDALRKRSIDSRAIILMAGLGLLLFALHILEIFLFAGFYVAVGAIDTLERALFYSASAYTTLGLAADHFREEWRMIGAFEALIGFVLIGWSTAFMVSTQDRLQDHPRRRTRG